MRRTHKIKRVLVGVSGALLMIAPIGFTQEAIQQSPQPVAVGPYLIAWSEFQKPKPVLDLPAQSRGNHQEVQPITSVQLTSPQVFAGTITRDGDRYFLRLTGGLGYQIDDSDRARAYEGQSVKLVASMDESGAILHLVTIRPS